MKTKDDLEQFLLTREELKEGEAYLTAVNVEESGVYVDEFVKEQNEAWSLLGSQVFGHEVF